MKFLVLLVILFGAWLVWRHQRRGEAGSARPPAPPHKPAGQPQDMVRCARCGLHLPCSEALAGPDGQPYCCTEHRAAG